MSDRLKCKSCPAVDSLPSLHAASAAGWALVDARHAGRITYTVLCPDCAKKARWLPVVMGEVDGERGAGKAGK